jgi:hypothetical protein
MAFGGSEHSLWYYYYYYYYYHYYYYYKYLYFRFKLSDFIDVRRYHGNNIITILILLL